MHKINAKSSCYWAIVDIQDQFLNKVHTLDFCSFWNTFDQINPDYLCLILFFIWLITMFQQVYNKQISFKQRKMHISKRGTFCFF